MKQIYFKINSKSLGDTLAATPSIRKVSNSYNQKINIVTYVPELFINNKYVDKIYSSDEFDKLKINKKDEVFETFCGIGVKDQKGVEKKHATIDIRRFHSMDLGFDLLPEEMEYDFIPNNDIYTKIDEKYICLHISKTWDSRTYSNDNWQTLIDKLQSLKYFVVLIGNNSSETGFFNINKTVHDLHITHGLDLTNKLNLSQLWHILDNSKCVVTMDSGILHFAGTTDTHIVQLGSSINNKLRAPYRKGSQNYKYNYISGPCNLFCASDMKYGIKEWGSINGVPPLVKCLENKASFECHPNPVVVAELVNQVVLGKNNNSKKYLFIAGHLSTGGAPKYLLWLINKIKNEGNKVKVLEWNLYSSEYTVQRNQIIDLVGVENFISLGPYYLSDELFYPNEKVAKDIIENYSPDYIHINDYIEQLAIKAPSQDFLSYLYDKNRKYKICETLHDSARDVNDKTYVPDEFWFCTKYHQTKYSRNDVPSFIYEMNIPKKIKPNRNETLLTLGLDPNYVHVLQVGLFNKNKNQKYTFELAKKFLNSKVQFHFLGNHCFMDECDIDKDQINCKIWGEVSNVDMFMSCMDMFILPSIAELNPISLKEALSWDMPCFVNRLETLKHLKDDFLYFLDEKNPADFINQMLSKNLNINSIIDSNIYNYSFNFGPRFEIQGVNNYSYEVKFIDLNDNTIHHKATIKNNMWTACSIEYFCRWRIVVKNLTLNIENIYDMDLNNKDICIVNESPSLGDLISWVPYTEEFQKQNNCRIDFFTPNKDLFEDQYSSVNFFNYNDQNKTKKKYYASYKIGCFNPSAKNLSPKDYRTIGLQEIASSILGLNHKEIITKISIKNKERKLNEKYVCISTASTSGCKHWHNENGWQNVVDYLNSLGYKVVVIQKEPLNYMDLKNLNNVIHPKTDSIHDAVSWLYNCEFFIGLSSGISWLAWALNKKVILISGFTKSFNEFNTPYRLINEKVCHGCWNNVNYEFNPGDWNWCPKFKNTANMFECSKSLTFEMVKSRIDEILNIENLNIVEINRSDKLMKKFDNFTYDEIFVHEQYEKFVKIKENDLVLDLGCSKGYFYFKNKSKNINYIGIDGSIDCINDFIENLNGDSDPLLINYVLSNKNETMQFGSMFHDNKMNTVLSITFPKLISLINKKIDFIKFDIEGFEKYFLSENYDLFKKNISRFSGEFHLTSSIMERQEALDILKKIQNDNRVIVKLFSIDAIDITESFWNKTNYYTEIIISGYIIS